MDARDLPEAAGVAELDAEDSGGLWRAGLAIIAKGQGRREVCLPSGPALRRHSLYPDLVRGSALLPRK